VIARLKIQNAELPPVITEMLLDIRKTVVEQTVAMNPVFDYEGLDDEVAQALLDLACYGERHREHLTRYARSRANRFVWVRASGWN
jgi:hypothetical protein